MMRPAMLVSLMVALGGVAALSWESLWQLRTTLSFGVSAVGTALTLAATTGGLAIGALVAGQVLRNDTVKHPLLLYGWFELVIGIAGLCMLPGFALLETADAPFYALSPVFAHGLQLAGVFFILAPATLAMGASVPVFQLLARAYNTRVSILYAANTAGAAVGVLLFGFVILEALGVVWTCIAIASVNISLFILTQWVVRHLPTLPASETDLAPRHVHSTSMSPPMALLAVTCTGLVTFGLEVTWFRALRSAFWSTSHTFSMLLAAVLISLALGARLVPLLRQTKITPAALLAASGVVTLLVTPLIERMDLVVISYPGTYYLTLAKWFGMTLALVGPSMLLLSTVLPWTLEDYPDTRMTGWLYGLNSIGAVAGAVLGAWVLLPNLGVARSTWLLAGLMLIVSVVVSRASRTLIPVAVGVMALALAASTTSSPGRDRAFGAREGMSFRILEHREGPDFTTTVVARKGGIRDLLIDGFSATSENVGGAHYMYWMGSLPALLHPNPQRGLVICFGTGQTANGLRLEATGDVDVVDVSSAVFSLAHHFRSNARVLDDPRIHPIVMDGRAWLRRTDVYYDVVTLEPMPPNFSGMNSLYSREFYEIMAERMNPGGIATQWLPTHLLSLYHAASIVATFVAVFPDAVLWWDPIGQTGVLLGRRPGSAEPLASVWPGFERRDGVRRLSDDQIRRSVFLEREGLLEYAASGDVITDDNQILQFGQIRPGLLGVRGQELLRLNGDILSKIAGRDPFTVTPRARQ